MAKPKWTPARATTGNPRMRAVMAACRRLGIDSEERHAIQLEITGKHSMSDMLNGDLDKLLDHLNRDWKGTNAQRPHIAKIRALWWSLYWLGEIRDPGEKALSSFVKRQCNVDALKFLDHTKAPAVIEALKVWCTRAGVKWWSADKVAGWSNIPDFTRARADRLAVIDAIAAKIMAIGGFPAAPEHWLAQQLGLHISRGSWNDRQIDEAIRLIGKQWHKQRPKTEPAGADQ